MNTQTNNGSASVTNTRQVINLFTDKNGKPLSAKQSARKIASMKRKATNESGKNLADAIREELFSLDIIRQIFAKREHITNESGNILPGESAIFCEALSNETGKKITVETVLKLPIRLYMDYVKEAEASRQFMRGITPKEFKDIITRFYREQKQDNKLDASARAEVLRRITLDNNI